MIYFLQFFRIDLTHLYPITLDLMSWLITKTAEIHLSPNLKPWNNSVGIDFMANNQVGVTMVNTR